MTSASLDVIVDVLRRRTGLRVDEHHRQRVAELIDEHATDRDTVGPGLLERPEVFDRLLDAVTIEETYFFRHRHQLAYLQAQVVPQLLTERPPGHVLQLWSAGCANGAEPYTLAMLLTEMGLDARAAILGTDVSPAALEQARGATYSRWARRSSSLATRTGIFSTTPTGRARLHDRVTSQVAFHRHNLLDSSDPRPHGGPPFDVILCRNVLLHLEPEAADRVLANLVAALAPGGWLITAPADPPVLGREITDAHLTAVTLPSGGVVHRRADADEGTPTRPAERRATAAPPTAGASRPRPRVPRAALTVGTSPAAPADASQAPAPIDEPIDDDAGTRCRRARALLESGDGQGALRDAMASVFLAPDLAVGHLTLGMAARWCGREAVATRAFRRASELLAALPADAPVELADGETAATLADMARAHALLAREVAR